MKVGMEWQVTARIVQKALLYIGVGSPATWNFTGYTRPTRARNSLPRSTLIASYGYSSAEYPSEPMDVPLGQLLLSLVVLMYPAEFRVGVRDAM